MKHPIWILNSTLLLTLLLVFVFIFSHWPQSAERIALTPKRVRIISTEAELQPGIIIENDLFGTFYTGQQKEVTEVSEIQEIPEPPQEVQAIIPPEALPNFLEPLPIFLTGIVMTDKQEYNRAVIYHSNLKEEVAYKIGDKIEDAQLVRIFSHKVIIIRSNGQQEVLYLNQEDAEADVPSMVHGYWDSVIAQIDSRTFIIDPSEFVVKVKNLAHFIELLDLTYAYQHNQSMGVYIGQLEKESFGPLLGLNPGDIIESIAGMTISNEEQAYNVYEKIISLRRGTQIPVVINRSGTRFTIKIYLKDIHASEVIMQQDKQGRTIRQTKSLQELEGDKLKLMHERYDFAPTIEELGQQEKEAMWYGGSKDATPTKLNTRNILSGR
ncbi:MAG TPA: hypothetical protein VJ201_04535 [Candidatus Babeliales bacterium]|nr:hypothetical protein [Candidatus Babeliales bacterium]